MDTCFLKGADLTENSVLLVVIDCGTGCRYAFYSYWEDIEHLKPN